MREQFKGGDEGWVLLSFLYELIKVSILFLMLGDTVCNVAFVYLDFRNPFFTYILQVLSECP